MPKPWAEVAANPQFKALPLEQQEQARDQFFREVVAPRVPPAKLDEVRAQFDADTKPRGLTPPRLQETAALDAPHAAKDTSGGLQDLPIVGPALYGIVTGVPGGKALAAQGRTLLNDKPYSENRADIEREATHAFHRGPVSAAISGAATIAEGALLGRGVIGKGPNIVRGEGLKNLGKVAKAGAKAGGAYGAATGVVEGGLKGANEGGVVEAVAQGAEEGAREGVSGLVGGSLLAPAIPAAAQAAAKTGRFIADRVSPSSASISEIGKAIRNPGETLADALDRLRGLYKQFQQVYGRRPALHEIVGEDAGARLGNVMRRRAVAADIATKSENTLAQSRQDELKRAVLGRQAEKSPAGFQAAATEDIKRTLAKIGGTPVKLPKSEAGDYVNSFAESGTPVIRSVEAARKELNKQIKRAADNNRDPSDLRRIRDEVIAIGEDASEGYANMLRRYGIRQEIATQMGGGRAARAPLISGGGRGTTGDASAKQVEDVLANATKAQRAGIRLGAKMDVAEAAGESPVAAVTTARSLAEDSGLNRRLAATQGEKEAARLRQVGEVTANAARGVSAAAAAAQRGTGNPQIDAAQEALRGVLLAKHPLAGPGFFVSTFKPLLEKAGLPLGTARKLAELATDSKKTEAIFDFLSHRGMSPEQIAALYRNAAAAAGVGTGQSVETVQ